jgi:ketosteroid isomerase-like protein
MRWSDNMDVSFPRRHILGIGAAFASVATFGDKAALAAPIDPSKTVKWDEKAGKEVLALLHHMHHAWNDGDLDFIKRSVADDGFIGTFELTGDEQAAVLHSRDELVTFVEKLFNEQLKTGARTEASPNRSHQVLATETFAICTEQCDLIERHADGTRHVLPHRGTSVLAKTADGWKFVHWHVSQGGPGRVYDSAGKAIS